ncbi:hypothetical protein [Mycobacterium vicinigordonae]|uniref:Uncharacterized protein n=1 Tax=Mycobacterium vicinigordonae TaxID=1719132 RepID=A0A7D6E1P2_9MYCO|nr:hypothetical protein [Mycobacterium vicinigordonae]QLL08989.1 hypothetical protein H0P51_08905 [Mycobacterium vicinigordonae]
MPPETFNHGDQWLGGWSGVGLGAIIGAIITGTVLFIIEGKRQSGENNRKLMELKRADQRLWNEDIRSSFVAARAQLNKFRTLVGRTRLSAHFSHNREEMISLYQQLTDVRAQLIAINDDLRIVADDDLVSAFNPAAELVLGFLKQFSVEGDHVTYKPETVNSTKVPDYAQVEQTMLQAVRTALKTPSELP